MLVQGEREVAAFEIGLSAGRKHGRVYTLDMRVPRPAVVRVWLVWLAHIVARGAGVSPDDVPQFRWKLEQRRLELVLHHILRFMI